MEKQRGYRAKFMQDNQILAELFDTNENKLLARASALLESKFHDAVCSIKETKTDRHVITLKRRSIN